MEDLRLQAGMGEQEADRILTAGPQAVRAAQEAEAERRGVPAGPEE